MIVGEELLKWTIYEAMWTKWLGVATFVMAGAVIAAALIAVITIIITKNIERNKIDIKRKSIAKNLLFEVNDNNYNIKTLEYMFGINDLLERGTIRVWEGPFYSDGYQDNFNNVINNIFIERSINIDFKQEDLNPSLRKYYQEILNIKESIKKYNEVRINENTLEKKKMLFTMLRQSIYLIKYQKLHLKVFDKLEKEADYHLIKSGFYKDFKPQISIKKLRKSLMNK